MIYQVLARKWRPRTFTEVVGQEHVLRALINALDNQRLHHAYLFTGTRGVGKTTLGRILAKSLNCERGVSATPCGECPACRAIDQGRFVDLMEVDAASRTKVEDTRELLENVQYPPTQGRYKVYLIDEVHMLSGHSFNALLKTLEEPPEHVKFLLATTDPQKLPVTVLSRCLRFNLKRIPRERIAAHLAHILDQEGIPYEAPALGLLARAADGSLRDALSLLDQAIAFGGGQVGEQATRDMLGDLDPTHLRQIVSALAEADGPALLSQVERLAESGVDFEQALEGLISTLHRIAVSQVVPQAAEGDDWVREMADRLPPEEIQLHYQIAIEARRDLPLAVDPRAGFEMALLRMHAFRPAAQGGTAPTPGAPEPATAPTTARAAPPTPPATPPRRDDHRAAMRTALAGKVQEADTNPPTEPTREPPRDEAPVTGIDDWRATAEVLPLGGVARQLALNCAWGGMEGDRVTLVIGPEHAHLATDAQRARLESALGEHLGRPVRLHLKVRSEQPAATPAQAQRDERARRLAEAREALARDPGLQALTETFDATLEEDSIRPTEPS